MTATTRLYTGEDLARMLGDEPWEIWDGELRRMPGAGSEANELAGAIFALIRPFVRSTKLGVQTTADSTYYLARDPDVLVAPDVAFVRWDRLPGRARPKGFAPVPPDLAVEVVPPMDSQRDVTDKMARSGGRACPWSGGSIRTGERSSCSGMESSVVRCTMATSWTVEMSCLGSG